MNPKVKEISREDANEIMFAHRDLPQQKVVICFAGKWYDIRELSFEEIEEFISYLTGIPKENISKNSVDINL